MIWAVTDSDPYSLGQTFWRRERPPLLVLARQPEDPSGRIVPWSLRFQYFDVAIVYKSGRRHTDAKCPSWAYLKQQTDDQEDDTAFLGALETSAVTQEKSTDSELRSLRECHEGHASRPPRLFMRSLPFFFSPKRYPLQKKLARATQLVVLTTSRDDILRASHDAPLSGHLGFTRTLARARQELYWPKLSTTSRAT